MTEKPINYEPLLNACYDVIQQWQLVVENNCFEETNFNTKAL